MLRIGVDLGGTKTEGIVMDQTGEILFRERRPTPQAHGYDVILDNIRVLVLDLEKMAGQSCRVGIGTPGVRASNGVGKKASIVTSLRNEACA